MILDCSCPFLFLCIYTIFHNLKARNIQAILLLAQCHAMPGSGKSLQIFGVRFASSARLRRSRRWSVRRNASGRAPATFRVVVAWCWDMVGPRKVIEKWGVTKWYIYIIKMMLHLWLSEISYRPSGGRLKALTVLFRDYSCRSCQF